MSPSTAKAVEYTDLAVQAKNAYTETQSAMWLILAEQGEKDVARAMDTEMIKLISRDAWLCARKLVKSYVGSLRDEDVAFIIPESFGPRDELQHYVKWKDSWLTDTEILREEAARLLDVYYTCSGIVIEARGILCTAAQVRESLWESGLAFTLDDIEKVMIAKGLIQAGPESVAPDDEIPEPVVRSPYTVAAKQPVQQAPTPTQPTPLDPDNNISQTCKACRAKISKKSQPTTSTGNDKYRLRMVFQRVWRGLFGTKSNASNTGLRTPTRERDLAARSTNHRPHATPSIQYAQERTDLPRLTEENLRTIPVGRVMQGPV